MVDLKLQVPATDEIEVDTQTLAAIDRGIEAANEGRSRTPRRSPEDDPRVDFQVRISDPALIDFEEILEYSWARSYISGTRHAKAMFDPRQIPSHPVLRHAIPVLFGKPYEYIAGAQRGTVISQGTESKNTTELKVVCVSVEH